MVICFETIDGVIGEKEVKWVDCHKSDSNSTLRVLQFEYPRPVMPGERVYAKGAYIFRENFRVSE